MKTLHLVMGLLVSLIANGLNAADSLGIIGNEPLPVIAQKVSCGRVYRVSCPLKQARKTLVIVFAVPTYQEAKARGAIDSIAYAMEHSTLRFVVFDGEKVDEQGTVNVDESIFRTTLATIVESEVFSLPEKKAALEEYVRVTALDSGMVTAERFDGTIKRVERVYGESTAVNYLADELRKIVGKAASRDWSEQTP